MSTFIPSDRRPAEIFESWEQTGVVCQREQTQKPHAIGVTRTFHRAVVEKVQPARPRPGAMRLKTQDRGH